MPQKLTDTVKLAEGTDSKGRTPDVRVLNHVQGTLDLAGPAGEMNVFRAMMPHNDAPATLPFRVETLRTIDEYLSEVAGAIGNAVAGVRFALNRWDRNIGLSLVSVSLTPLGADGSAIDLTKLGELKGPTIGLMPGRFPRQQRKCPHDRLMVKVGFSPSEGCIEALRVLTDRFHGAIIDASKPVDDSMPPELGRSDTSLVANSSQRIEVVAPCFNFKALQDSGLPFQAMPSGPDDRLVPLPDQAYFCRYKLNAIL
ncbi:hypothetical protein HZA42_04740 [Candidatus Peregrinibacteria bacterium]|nr:hypothetical protein [Candidatus Peregrinibacteria bacterium]